MDTQPLQSGQMTAPMAAYLLAQDQLTQAALSSQAPER